MISRPLNEAVPYLLVAVGASGLIHLQQPWSAWAGLLLFWIGALLWIQRSHCRSRLGRHYPAFAYRNHDKTLDQPLDLYQAPYSLPGWLYEAKPFVALTLACLCWRYWLIGSSNLLLLAAILLSLAGLTCWFLRGRFRGYHRSPRFQDHPLF